ncbi:MAG: dihydrofolate reductase [Marivirga sp.]|nr:dihydrofolate reductase [Marivirga sp.]
MRKLVLFMHASLDGFVGGTKGEMDWIKVDEAMFDSAALRTAESDLALYGRVTYEMMDSYWPTAADQPNATKHDIEHSTWYNKVSKVIVSKSMEGKKLKNATIVSDNIGMEISKIKQHRGKDILIFGSPSTSHTLMQADLIDEFWIFVNPMILGEGIPLFTGLKERQKLKLLESKTFASGVVCLHYERDRTE